MLLHIFLNPKGLIYLYMVIPVPAALVVRMFLFSLWNLVKHVGARKWGHNFFWLYTFHGAAWIGLDLWRVNKVYKFLINSVSYSSHNKWMLPAPLCCLCSSAISFLQEFGALLLSFVHCLEIYLVHFCIFVCFLTAQLLVVNLPGVGTYTPSIHLYMVYSLCKEI